MTDRPKLDAAGIEEFRQRAWDIMREDDYNDANAICDLALRGLAQREAPQDGIERAREWLDQNTHSFGGGELRLFAASCLAAYAASEVSRVRRETLEQFLQRLDKTVELAGFADVSTAILYCHCIVEKMLEQSEALKEQLRCSYCEQKGHTRETCPSHAKNETILRQVFNEDCRECKCACECHKITERDLATERAQNEGLREKLAMVRRETLLLAAKGCCWTDRTAIMKLLDGQEE